VPMVLVPAGCFIDKMLTSHCFQTAFWIDKYEVTQAVFERLGGVKEVDNYWQGDQLPVINITSEEAQLFCQIRGGRLPTHIEWEYATLSKAGHIHSLASQIDLSQIVASHTSEGQPAEVGSFPQAESWVGALDLLGNVWEWTTVNNQHYTLLGGSWRSLPHLLSIASVMSVIPDFTSDDTGFRCVIEG
jgi:formylglycine-generating enzyme required for sulfatase activity